MCDKDCMFCDAVDCEERIELEIEDRTEDNIVLEIPCDYCPDECDNIDID